MSIDIDERKRSHPLHTRKGGEMTLSPEQIEALEIAAEAEAAEAEAAEREMQLVMPSPLNYLTGGLSEESNKLREKIEELKKENGVLKKKIEEIESKDQKQEGKIRDLESSQDKLQKELEKVKTEKDQLRIEVEALTKENKELKRKLEKMSASNTSLRQDVDLMREENQQLKDEMGILKFGHKEISEKLECKDTRLALGQVAWLLEAEMWKAVLPDQKMGYTGILNSMKRWLNKNSSTPKGKAAQQRWDDLKEKLKWDEDDHSYALKCLKKLRVEDAHPNYVDLEKARKQLNEGAYVADADKKACEDIIDMVVTARKLNNS